MSAALVVAGAVAVTTPAVAQAAVTAFDTNAYTKTFAATGDCAQTYVVPAGVRQIGVDAIGAAGAAGQSNTVNSAANGTAIAGGTGGQGSRIQATVAVTPGQTLYLNAASAAMAGGSSGEAAHSDDQPAVNGAGGSGGNASFVSASDPHSSGSCNPAGSDLLVVAAGGGGGGGASTYYNHTGGGGGTEGGAAAGAGGNNSTHDGGPGGTATTTSGGSQGADGHGYDYTPIGPRTCWPGSAGSAGTANGGGAGGAGALVVGAQGCGGYYYNRGGFLTNGGGGGGGGGFYGGGGGGGADDSRTTGGGGGGGGAGASYVADQTASPTASTGAPGISITPVMTAPAFSAGAAGGTCVVNVYCHFSFATTGFPVATLGLSGGDLDLSSTAVAAKGLRFTDTGSGVATLAGAATADQVGVHTVTILAQNTTTSTASSVKTFALTIGYGPLAALTMTPTQTVPLTAHSATSTFTLTGRFTSGYTRDLSSAASWTTSDPTVATVSGGVVRALSPGTVTITAGYGGQTSAQTLTVDNGAVTTLSVTPAVSGVGPNPTVGLGRTLQWQATASYANGTVADVTDQVVWRSSGSTVAPITAGGLATATGDGEGISNRFTATLTNADGSTVTADAGLTVTLAQPLSIAVTPSVAGPLPAGGAQQFTATGTFPGGRTADLTRLVRWQSSSAAATFTATVPGLLQSAPTSGGGSVAVTAWAPATGSGTGSVTATASVTFAAGLPVSISAPPPAPSAWAPLHSSPPPPPTPTAPPLC